MARKVIASLAVTGLIALGMIGMAPAAGAATTTKLFMGGNAAFAILGHWCGGITQKVYATGFAGDGYPTGAAFLSTTCSGSGRGGHPTTYTAWGSVTWDWFGETRSYAKLAGAPEGISETFSAEDSHHDHLYNVGTSAYLETTEPPLVPPAQPTSVSAYVSVVEVGEKEEARFQVGWTPAPETAGLITSSKVVAVPVSAPTEPTLEATVNGAGSSVLLAPLARQTTYRITVTNTDLEGTSEPSEPIEVNSITPEEEAEKKQEELEPKPPEFGRCVKAPGEKIEKTTYYYGGYTTATCLEASATHTGKYEWEPGVVKGGFTTAIKTAPVKLEGENKAKVTCTGESSSGAITGAKTVGNEQLTFTGCESGGQKCTTSGLAEGELRTSNLEGTLGVEKITIKEGKETIHVALDLVPVGKSGPFLEYTCAGSEATTLSGSVLVPVTAGKMVKTMPLKFAATGGLQKPESLEEGPQDVLKNSIGEQIGLTLSATQANEEAIEINPVV